MLRHRRSILPALAVMALVGCAASGDPNSDAGATSQPTPAPSLEEIEVEEVVVDPSQWPPSTFSEATMPPADAAGQGQADAWLAGVVVPPSAVPLDEEPADAPMLSLQWQEWWCAPMGLATGYWRVPDMGVIEVANWLAANPGPGLMSPMQEPFLDDGTPVDGTSVSHVPTIDAIEGIGFTVAVAAEGVVVRAQVGAFGDTTACPTPPPGETLGGPGQG